MKQKTKWMKHYYELLLYKDKHGNIDVPRGYILDDGVDLRSWKDTQIQKYNNTKGGKLTPLQIDLLEDLLIVWNKRNDNWEEKYELLKKYYEEYGNIDVPSTSELGIWLKTQRNAYNKKYGLVITKEHIDLLNVFPMKWNINEDRWMEKYYKFIESNPFLLDRKNQQWLDTQKKAYKKEDKSLTPKKIKLLNDANVDWSYYDTKKLNSEITEDNKTEYNKVLLNRLKFVLRDIRNEVVNDINSKEDQELIEKEMIKRIWR